MTRQGFNREFAGAPRVRNTIGEPNTQQPDYTQKHTINVRSTRTTVRAREQKRNRSRDSKYREVIE